MATALGGDNLGENPVRFPDLLFRDGPSPYLLDYRVLASDALPQLVALLRAIALLLAIGVHLAHGCLYKLSQPEAPLVSTVGQAWSST